MTATPDPKQMTPQEKEAWMQAYWRFRETRPKLVKKAAIAAALLILDVLVFYFFYLSGSSTEHRTGPFYGALIYGLPLFWLLLIGYITRLDHGWKVTEGEHSFNLSYKRVGIRAEIERYFVKWLQDIKLSSDRLVELIPVLVLVSILVFALIQYPHFVVCLAIILSVFVGSAMLDWYVWLKPVEEFRREMEAEDSMHIRGAKVIDMPDASSSSPTKE